MTDVLLFAVPDHPMVYSPGIGEVVPPSKYVVATLDASMKAPETRSTVPDALAVVGMRTDSTARVAEAGAVATPPKSVQALAVEVVVPKLETERKVVPLYHETR